MEPKPISTGFIAAVDGYVVIQLQVVPGLLNLFFQSFKVPGGNGLLTSSDSIATQQFPAFVGKLIGDLHTMALSAIFGLDHLRMGHFWPP
jgi:hypothetical protein